MKKLIVGALAVILAMGLAGCAGVGSGGAPCANCSYAYVPAHKNVEGRAFCEINGKKVDCKKTPAECPECAKAGH